MTVVGEKQTIALDLPPRRGGRGIARIRRTFRFDQQHMRFVFGVGRVLDAFRHDEHFALLQRHVAVAEADDDLALQHQEEIVSVVVLVPGKLTISSWC